MRQFSDFVTLARGIPNARFLEIGTKRSNPDNSTHHKRYFQNASYYVMTDYDNGMDVDVVSDAHDLKEFADAEFDVVIAASVWEHLDRPWVAAEAVARVLRPGGLAYIDSHQTFPVHGYPYDSWRFTERSMHTMFDEWFQVHTWYAFPCRITPSVHVDSWNEAAEAFLNVTMAGVRR